MTEELPIQDSYHHTNGIVCVWNGRFWQLPLGGKPCLLTHHSDPVDGL